MFAKSLFLLYDFLVCIVSPKPHRRALKGDLEDQVSSVSQSRLTDHSVDALSPIWEERWASHRLGMRWRKPKVKGLKHEALCSPAGHQATVSGNKAPEC